MRATGHALGEIEAPDGLRQWMPRMDMSLGTGGG